MSALTRMRHLLAPALGAVVLVVALFGLDLGPVMAVILGALVWGGAALTLMPRRRFGGLAKAQGLVYDAEMIRGELEAAVARVASIRRLGSTLALPGISDQLGRITASAEAIINDVERSPADYRRMRKALTHYLGHVETIAERVAYMHGTGALDRDTRQRTERTLSGVEQVFVDYTRRMVQDEAHDLDARIALLEQEIRAEGVVPRGSGDTPPAAPGTGRRRQGGKA